VGVLKIPTLRVSDGALREGLLYDLLGRLKHEDARERSVRAMMARYNVDEIQANRVASTASTLLMQCAENWELQFELAGSMLDWSARLHEIGLDISHDGFHRHGAYIAEYADMPGFPRAEQRFLAFLISSQRHSINLRFNKRLPQNWRESALRLEMILRLAVLLNRSRRDDRVPQLRLSVDGKSLRLEFNPAWIDANPLTATDLSREQSYVSSIGYELEYC
jgi:exopolyphosphatase/guanosine-5'-triphosphate,3'-diphosphate pyrophosphatase